MITTGVHQGISALHGDLTDREASIVASTLRLLADGCDDHSRATWSKPISNDLLTLADEVEARADHRRAVARAATSPALVGF